MILDNTNIFSDAQPVTATARSTNVIDLGAAGTAYGHASALNRDVGKGSEIMLTCNVVEAFNNLTSLQISVQSDDNAAFSSPKEVASRTFTLAEINSVKVLSFPAELPEGTDERYVSLLYTVTGTAPTAGKITCAAVAARQTN